MTSTLVFLDGIVRDLTIPYTGDPPEEYVVYGIDLPRGIKFPVELHSFESEKKILARYKKSRQESIRIKDGRKVVAYYRQI